MYTKYNAENVLIEVEKKIDKLTRYGGKFRIGDVYDELSIFDWWPEYIGVSRLKDMRKFLKEAIKLGYTGYVCFKVGASGCANGMWAHKENSTDGYSPDGTIRPRVELPITKEQIYDEMCRVLTNYENAKDGDKLTEYELYEVLVKIQNNWETVITVQND